MASESTGDPVARGALSDHGPSGVLAFCVDAGVSCTAVLRGEDFSYAVEGVLALGGAPGGEGAFTSTAGALAGVWWTGLFPPMETMAAD
jgi:hypothetical protein